MTIHLLNYLKRPHKRDARLLLLPSQTLGTVRIIGVVFVQFLRAGVCPEAAYLLEEALNKAENAVPPR